MNKNMLMLLLLLALFTVDSYSYKRMNQFNNKEVAMKISSPSFLSNQTVPSAYTCEGQDISPQLYFENVPAQAKSLVLICDDPDAPGKIWVHWIVYNLPATVNTLSEGASIAGLGGKEGVTDFGKQSYGGPCPPKGHGLHHYHFKLYALDTMLDLPAGATQEQVMNALNSHKLAEAELVGTYKRF
jgi:Raf kinase inhibitor-like YbhB/YbcL family protein